MSTGIAVHGLVKTYGATRVVDDLSFSCPRGAVTALLGPNGSGKSTTMRLMLGFARPTSGTASFDGTRYVDLPNPGREVGVLLDAGALHAGRGTRETLRLAATLIGVGVERADECLALVGLQEVGRRRVGSLSLGMRQRLGLALALLGSPRYLVLDEPLNGLDPEGVRWMRSVMRHVAEAGGAVLVSSHLLREVEAVADHVVIIDKGRLVAEGRTSSVTGTTHATRARSLDDAALSIALSSSAISSRPAPGGGLLIDASPEEVGRAAVEARVVLTALGPDETGDLETTFLSSTTGEFIAGDTAALVEGAR